MPITKLQQIAYDAYLRNDKSIRPKPRDLGLAYLGVRHKIIAAKKWINAPEGQKAAVENTFKNLACANCRTALQNDAINIRTFFVQTGDRNWKS